MNKKNMLICGIIVVLIIAIILLFVLSQNKSEQLTLSTVIEKFKEAGIEVDLKEKPYFSMIGAKDGEMFYLDNSPVKLYEYENKQSFEQALKNYSILKNMPNKGLIVLDTNSTKAIEIFNSL